MRDARVRKDFVSAELAAGRDPAVSLRALEHPTPTATFSEWFERFIESRIDVGKKTISLYRNARATLGALADRAPVELVAADFQDWIARNGKLSPKTLRHYIGTIRQVIDFAGVEPNPAKSPRVKLPSQTGEEIAPPSGADWLKIKARLSKGLLLPLRLKECCGLRTKEIRELTYGDIDFADEKIRVSRARTKGRSAGQRWLPVPAELLDEIADRVALEDRQRDRLVFPEIAESTLWAELDRACRLAGVAHYPPHQLRHRRCSLWLAMGVDEVQTSRWAGHAKPSMTLNVYAHVLIDPASDEWREFWTGVYLHGREARVRSLRPDEGVEYGD
jgi:integrase